MHFQKFISDNNKKEKKLRIDIYVTRTLSACNHYVFNSQNTNLYQDPYRCCSTFKMIEQLESVLLGVHSLFSEQYKRDRHGDERRNSQPTEHEHENPG